jgi:hypothetical protein
VSALNLPLTQAHYPATFAERGVATPFTTPMLAGARVRIGRKKVAEYVLPNPSGGRGVYIVTWSGVRRFCNPTVHDTLVQERINGLPALSPAILRRAARQLAANGYLGLGAIQAALAAEAAEQSAVEHARQLLLEFLAEQMRIPACGTSPSQAEAEARDRQAILKAAARLACSPEQIGRGLSALARSLAAVGLESGQDAPRLAASLLRINRLRESLLFYAEAGQGPSDLARDVAGCVRVTLACADILLHDARAQGVRILDLLQVWLTARTEAERRIERLDWLLDGWERLCLLWEGVGEASQRRIALLEIAQQVPVLPPEVQIWVGQQLPPGAFQPGWRVVSMDDGWRSGSATFGLVARNERLRTLSV